MKIYFLSSVKAALKLDGEYVGIIDNFERWCDIDNDKCVLAEIIPDGNLQPLNFFICENFFRTPQSFADICTGNGFRSIYIHGYYNKNWSPDMILQQKFCDYTVTIYRQGGIFLSCEGTTFENYPMPEEYENAVCKEITLCKEKMLAICGGRWLALVNIHGKLVFLNEVESYSFGDILEVKAPLPSCTDSFAECAFSYANGKMNAINSHTAERHKQGEKFLPFVFFERILNCGDYENMLCKELKPKAKSLKKYLGGFIAVTVPHYDFYVANPGVTAAGLVYEKSKNLYEIICFALDTEDGKITNIRPL